MNKYRIDYMDGDGEIITIEVETLTVVKTNSLLIFHEEDGEVDYVFLKKDFVNCKIIEEK